MRILGPHEAAPTAEKKRGRPPLPGDDAGPTSCGHQRTIPNGRPIGGANGSASGGRGAGHADPPPPPFEWKAAAWGRAGAMGPLPTAPGPAPVFPERRGPPPTPPHKARRRGPIGPAYRYAPAGVGGGVWPARAPRRPRGVTARVAAAPPEETRRRSAVRRQGAPGGGRHSYFCSHDAPRGHPGKLRAICVVLPMGRGGRGWRSRPPLVPPPPSLDSSMQEGEGQRNNGSPHPPPPDWENLLTTHPSPGPPPITHCHRAGPRRGAAPSPAPRLPWACRCATPAACPWGVRRRCCTLPPPSQLGRSEQGRGQRGLLRNTFRTMQAGHPPAHPPPADPPTELGPEGHPWPPGPPWTHGLGGRVLANSRLRSSPSMYRNFGPPQNRIDSFRTQLEIYILSNTVKFTTIEWAVVAEASAMLVSESSRSSTIAVPASAQPGHFVVHPFYLAGQAPLELSLAECTSVHKCTHGETSVCPTW